MFCFNDKPVNPIDVLFQANSIISEYFKFAMSQAHDVRLTPSQIRYNQVWRPPWLDTVKVNSDASFCLERKKSCPGIIARDRRGMILYGITKCFAASSPLIAEALALREAVAVTCNFGVTNVIFECDNLDLIQACRGEHKVGEINYLVQDVLQIKEQFQSCGFTWVARGGNKVAHQIALLNMQGNLPLHWRWNHPDSLQLLLNRDRDFST